MRRATQIAAALAVWTAGAVHLYLWDAESYRSIHVIGPLFLLNGIAAAVLGVLLLVTAHPLVILANVGYTVTTLVAFAISASNGLFGWKEVWLGTPQEVAAAAELAAVGLLLVLAGTRAQPLRRPGRRRYSRGEPFTTRT